VWNRIFGPKRQDVTRERENYVRMRFKIVILQEILLGWQINLPIIIIIIMVTVQGE